MSWTRGRYPTSPPFMGTKLVSTGIEKNSFTQCDYCKNQFIIGNKKMIPANENYDMALAA
jgi:hypothetical protein